MLTVLIKIRQLKIKDKFILWGREYLVVAIKDGKIIYKNPKDTMNNRLEVGANSQRYVFRIERPDRKEEIPTEQPLPEYSNNGYINLLKKYS